MEVYLLQNDSRFILEEQVKKIIGNETNIVSYDYLFESLEIILEEASYLSLFDEKKIVIVKNALCFSSDKLNEITAKMLDSYLNNPNENTILIFTLTEKIDERKKITKIIKDKHQLIIIPKLKPAELISKITTIFKENKMKIDYNIAKFICESSLNNYDLIHNEILKILLYYNNTSSEVKEEDVKNLISKSIEDNIFKYCDAVIAKDTAKMFDIFKDLKILKIEPIIIINSLAREYRLLLKTMILLNKNSSKYDIARELGLQDWLINKKIDSTHNYRTQELKEIIKSLGELDISVKSGKIDKYLGIELFMLDI